MSLWSRIANGLRGDSLNREIDEEFASHIDEAIRQGREPAEARQAFGSVLRQRESSRDVRLIAWFDSLRADAVFGWRQLSKRKMTSAAAILSLALSIGACTAAFWLADALLLRQLPITAPERLYSCYHTSILFGGNPITLDNYEYPMFLQMRAAVKDQAELIALSAVNRTDLTYGSDLETEKAYVQYVSGPMFGSFGLQPTLGRQLTEADDLTPGVHPYAVLSYDYWNGRFDRDPRIVGRTFRMGGNLFEVIGVAQPGFTGVEPGTVTDIFVPTMMNPGVTRLDRSWIRIMAHLKPGIAPESVRDRLRVPFLDYRAGMVKRRFTGTNKERIDKLLAEALMLEPAGAGVSRMQREFRQPLAALSVLVALVLLIACANVANLMTAQAASRTREMALRVSIGAGRWRLLQLVLMESAWIASLASALGFAFAWWSAPFIVDRINPPGNPARLILTADWRVLCFTAALTLAATFLFGLVPALRTSAIKPASALKGGDDPHSRRRLMHILIAVQTAFCFVVLFVSGLFLATFDRLSNQPTGFSAERILTVDTQATRTNTAVFWEQIADHLRSVPGVEKVALSGWPLLRGDATIGSISVDGQPASANVGYFLDVSPGWIDVMKIGLIAGRDFRQDETEPGSAMVSEAFAKQFFHGENVIGRYFENAESRERFQIVGLVHDARYRDVRGPMLPVAYVPFRWVDASGAPKPKRWATFVVRSAMDKPETLSAVLRKEVTTANGAFHAENIQSQLEINQSHTVRERLLALLALFFAVVALLLAGVGLYGVLNSSVLQRRKEIGIRVAIGARPLSIVRLVTFDALSMVFLGAAAGLALGLASVRSIASLMYQVKGTDAFALALPAIALLVAASLAALPAVIHAVRIDPAQMLRSE